MRILGIETSCDETAAAVAELEDGKIRILSNIVSSQIEIHQIYGGVVPEVAAREHVLNIIPVVNEALLCCGRDRKSNVQKIDAIAVTKGPGLITSLMIGLESAKALALAWARPLVPVNHIEGHMAANFIGIGRITDVRYPAVALTVSGGHTMLVLSLEPGKYETVGETRDDAAGEAFDKAAKLMGIGYPGGPLVAGLARKAKPSKAQNGIVLPRPMLKDPSFDFSFSGLKTALRYALEKDTAWPDRIPEYCFEFQQAVVDVLVAKTIRAARHFSAKTVMLSGGVAANEALRSQLAEAAAREDYAFLLPDLQYTTDNAAMIAAAGCLKAGQEPVGPLSGLSADCSWEL